MKEEAKIPTEDEKKAMAQVLFPVSAVLVEAELALELESMYPSIPIKCTHLKSLYDCCRRYLQVRSHVHHEPVDLNVGEEFDLDVGIKNKSSPLSWDPSRPDIVFKDIRLYVYGTSYARPVAGIFVADIVSGRERLRAGQARFRRIRMLATQAIPAEDESGVVEDVARIYVRASVDWERLFKLRKQRTAYHQIVRT